VRRVVIWCTPFGDAIRRFYERELYGGRSIRWDDELVRMAERTAARNGVDIALRETWLQEQRGYVMSPPPDMVPRHEPPLEYRPEFVVGEAERRRWRLACRAARRRYPTLGSERLLQEAVTVFEEGTLEAPIRCPRAPHHAASLDETVRREALRRPQVPMLHGSGGIRRIDDKRSNRLRRWRLAKKLSLESSEPDPPQPITHWSPRASGTNDGLRSAAGPPSWAVEACSGASSASSRAVEPTICASWTPPYVTR
jgi:hypothetical protein